MRISFFLTLYLILQVPILFALSEGIGETAQVIDHSEDLKKALTSHDFERSQLLLSKRDSPKIEIYNLTVSPFYELYINWDFAEARKIKDELNVTYGNLLNLDDYNKLFNDTYSHLVNIEPTDENRLLGIQAFAGSGNEAYEGGILELFLLMAKGASISLDNPIKKERMDAIALQSSKNEISTIEANPKKVVSSTINAKTSAINPPVKEVAEVIEEVAAPESAIEEPAEVVVAEPIEEDVEQSSNWWLWLVGVVVVVGGVLAVSRKS